MGNEDLLFNLLYFSDSKTTTAAQMTSCINSAMEETVALYSEHNTPYKMTPLSEASKEKLKIDILSDYSHFGDEKDCLVCRELMEINSQVLWLPMCKHCFHYDCIMKWFDFQNSCPICRLNNEVTAVVGSDIIASDNCSNLDDSEILPTKFFVA